MRRAAKHRAGWAVSASVAAHLAALAFFLTHRWTFDLPPEAPDAPWEHVITVQLAPRPRAAAASASPQTAILGRAPRPDEAPLPFVPRGPAVAPPPAQAAPGPLAQGPGVGDGGAASDLGAALRHGVLGCANAPGLSREARERCEEKLGAGAKGETVLAESRDPRIQAYFDAVAKAKAPDKPWTPTRAIGAMGIGQDIPRYSNDRLPMIGCAIPFGPGAKQKKVPAHWLKLGPCIIAPPKGPFTTEVDITPPDQDLSHPPPRSGPQAPPGVRPQMRHENAAAAPAFAPPTQAEDNARNADGGTSPH